MDGDSRGAAAVPRSQSAAQAAIRSAGPNQGVVTLSVTLFILRGFKGEQERVSKRIGRAKARMIQVL
jgi:hypothetical protein